MEQKFFTCFVEGTTGSYGAKHDNLDSAMTEAERLVRMPSNRNKKVYVLEMVRYCEAQEIPVVPVVWTRIIEKLRDG